MSTTTHAADVFHAHYAALEAGRLDEAVQFFTPSARVRFANNDWLVGREAIRANLEQLTSPVASVQHEFRHVIDCDYPMVCADGVVTYVLRNGARVAVEGSMFCQFDGGLIAEQRVYVDLTPVYAAVAALDE